MSSCLAFYSKDFIYMCGDSATCTRYTDGKLYRINENAEKISKIGDKIIFLSGLVTTTNMVLENFKRGDNSINSLQDAMKTSFALFNVFETGTRKEDNNIGAIVGTWENGIAVIYCIDSVNNFEIERIIGEEYVLDAVVEGIKKDEVAERAGYYFNKFNIGKSNFSGDLLDVYHAVYDDVNFEGIGGTLTVWGIDNGKFFKTKDYQINEKKNIARITDVVGVKEHCIKDDQGRLRAALGQYDSENGKFGLMLKDSQGDKTILDEDGMLQTYGFVVPDNLDQDNPMSITFFVDSGVKEVRECRVHLLLDNFRAYSKSASAGGGDSYTSENGGEYITDSNNAWDANSTNTAIPITVEGVASHYHHYNFNHTHKINAHYHIVNLPDHVHGLNYGIYKGSKASNVGVTVNGKTITTNINSNTDLDIAEYLTTGSWNTLELSSSSLGRIVASLYFKMFVTT